MQLHILRSNPGGPDIGDFQFRAPVRRGCGLDGSGQARKAEDAGGGSHGATQKGSAGKGFHKELRIESSISGQRWISIIQHGVRGAENRNRQALGLTTVRRFDIVSNVLIYQRLVGATSQILNLFGAGGRIVVLRLESTTEDHRYGLNRQLIASMTRRLGRGQ
jgi:hypothetical protein